MVEGIGAAVLLFLAQHAAAGALDRVAGARIDAFRANRQKRNAFDRSVALAPVANLGYDSQHGGVPKGDHTC